MVLGVIFLIIVLFLAISGFKAGESKRYYRRRSSNRLFPPIRWRYYETSDGKDLEEEIGYRLSKFENAGGKVICDCYLHWNNGSTTQIDAILIFRSGIYVIECKDYSGWIFGNGSNENWTQTLPYGYDGDYTKNSFYNPIKQNQNHILCVRQKLRSNSIIPIHNIVVFGDNCTFKALENTQGAYVIQVSELYDTIQEIDQEIGTILTPTGIENTYSRLIKDANVDSSIEGEHVRKVQNIKWQKEQAKHQKGTTCPYCGSPLVLRNGQYGRFYGCMRYPSCKYTKGLEE